MTSLELNHKSVERATRGQEVCVKIEPLSSEAPKMFGRHFDATDAIVSKVRRRYGTRTPGGAASGGKRGVGNAMLADGNSIDRRR